MDEDARESTGPPVVPETAVETTPSDGKCPGCGETSPPNEEFCGRCGASLKGATSTTPVVTRELSAEELEEVNLLTLPPIPIVVAIDGSTNLGRVVEYKKDDVNEDAFVIKQIDYPIHKVTVLAAIVADGMGGEAAGELFSEIAVSEAWAGLRFQLPYFEHQVGFDREAFWRFTNLQISKQLMPVMTATNRRIYNTGRAKKFKAGEFGTTIVLAVAVCDLATGRVKIHGYNEGDARCVLVCGDKLLQLSRDQTVMGKPNRFLGKSDDAGGFPFSHDIWFAEADFHSFNLLLYSDGLWNMLSDQQIIDSTNDHQQPRELTDALIHQALTVEVPHGRTLGDDKVQPGDDNVTVAAIRCSARQTT